MMRVDIIVVATKSDSYTGRWALVPSLTGIHLAALTPDEYKVKVIYQEVEAVNYETEADLVALSFTSACATQAYEMADCFRKRSKQVVCGGLHPSLFPDETLEHCDGVMIGEAEDIWVEMLSDASHGCLKTKYRGIPQPISNVPMPRYDLLPDAYVVKKVVQATRGCAYRCTFCSVPIICPGYRMREMTNVLRDVSYDCFSSWWQRKLVWFWDDNLCANRHYIKELLTHMLPMKKWWVGQTCIDVAEDEELLDLMRRSGCIGLFIGLESFVPKSLASVNKLHNDVGTYRRSIAAIHKHGIAVMSGFIAGLDGDTPETINQMSHLIEEVGVDVPVLSILTPYKGTLLYAKLREEGRLLGSVEGSPEAFSPKNMSYQELQTAYENLLGSTYSSGYTMKRIVRSTMKLRPAAAALSVFMNSLSFCYQLPQKRKPET